MKKWKERDDPDFEQKKRRIDRLNQPVVISFDYGDRASAQIAISLSRFAMGESLYKGLSKLLSFEMEAIFLQAMTFQSSGHFRNYNLVPGNYYEFGTGQGNSLKIYLKSLKLFNRLLHTGYPNRHDFAFTSRFSREFDVRTF